MTTSRREFLQQLSCAFAVAGVASVIPLQVHDEEPEIDIDGIGEFLEMRGGWTQISIPLPVHDRITGMVMFRDMLVITTEQCGVWTIPNALEQIETWRYEDVTIHLTMRPGEWGEGLTINHLGHGPYVYSYSEGIAVRFDQARHGGGPTTIRINNGPMIAMKLNDGWLTKVEA